MSFRKLFVLVIFFVGIKIPVLAAAQNLTQLEDIREFAQLATQKNLPILLMFSTDGCPYCEMLKEDFLIPMTISGAYNDKVIIIEVHIAYMRSITYFDGKSIGTEELAQQYRVSVYPTMVFIDAKGRPLADSIVGINTPSSIWRQN